MATSCSFSACKLTELQYPQKAANSLQSSFSNRFFPAKSAPLSSGLMKCMPTLTGNRGCSVRCSVLETRNPVSISAGKNFQLEDVIEAQQFNRDILSATFE
ncbi:hypothetical protein CRG98_043889, partial [Punica granatum]